MPRVSRYYLSGNTNISSFNPSDFGVDLTGTEIVVTGSAQVDSVFVNDGFKLDFFNSADGIDDIYLSGGWADYRFYKTKSDVMLQSYDTLVILIAGSTDTQIRVNQEDKLIFTNGSILVSDVIAAVHHTNADDANSQASSLPASFELSENYGSFDSLLPSENSTVSAYATDHSGEGVIFAQNSNTAMVVRGSGGVDIVYVKQNSVVEVNAIGSEWECRWKLN